MWDIQLVISTYVHTKKYSNIINYLLIFAYLAIKSKVRNQVRIKLKSQPYKTNFITIAKEKETKFIICNIIKYSVVDILRHFYTVIGKS